MQFCFCLRRTEMHLRHCCMAAKMFFHFCKCSVVHICNERCTTRCRNNFRLSLAIVRAYFNTNIVLLYLNWFWVALVLGIAQLQYAILVCVLCHICSAAACSCKYNRCMIVLHATCNMQIRVLTWFWIHDCSVQILLRTCYTIIICIALYCIYSIFSAH